MKKITIVFLLFIVSIVSGYGQSTTVNCSSCNGSGRSTTRCVWCSGSGIYNNYGVKHTCYYCGGSGFDRCITCIGSGKVTLSVAEQEIAAFNRGATAYNQGNYDVAIREYTEAIRLFPNRRWESYYNRGMAYALRGQNAINAKVERSIYIRDFNSAIEDFSQALRIGPVNNIKILENRGTCYMRILEFDLCISDWEEVLRIDPNNHELKRSLILARSMSEYR